jgi:SWI/SNF-related matrix-associated actin-dependent regulator of chromatin subfamily A member 5
LSTFLLFSPQTHKADHWLTFAQEVDETPDYTDSDTNPNTTASSVVGEPIDGRKRRTEVNQLRRSIFGKKHDVLGESKVRGQLRRSEHPPMRAVLMAISSLVGG